MFALIGIIVFLILYIQNRVYLMDGFTNTQNPYINIGGVLRRAGL